MLEQICVMGSGLPAPVAVVVLSETARKLPKEAVDASVKATLVDVNKQLESHERLARVIIVAVDWTTQNGMLTPTLKIKRDVLEERYRPLLDEQHTAFVVWE
jgi:long-subunit acyl-CoA synthetase (AMP-forming)